MSVVQYAHLHRFPCEASSGFFGRMVGVVKFSFFEKGLSKIHKAAHNSSFYIVIKMFNEK
jgi:hypothetical protein